MNCVKHIRNYVGDGGRRAPSLRRLFLLTSFFILFPLDRIVMIPQASSDMPRSMVGGKEEKNERDLRAEDTRKRLDQSALEAIRGGDWNRFQEIIERYQHRIVTLIARQTGDAALAEDLAQDVFIRAYRGLKTFKGDSEFSTWLIRIALNVTNSYFTSKRHKQKTKSESFDPIHHDRPQDQGDNEEKLLKERRDMFRDALSELKPHLRDVVVLCALEGKQYQEAADALGIPIGTVRSRLNKARLELKVIMGVPPEKGEENA